MLDVLIKNGRIIDGTGNPWFRADIGIWGNKIGYVGRTTQPEAKRVIDAAGFSVSPDFIDTHTHSDLRVFKYPEEDYKLMQGITTALIGQDWTNLVCIFDAILNPSNGFLTE